MRQETLTSPDGATIVLPDQTAQRWSEAGDLLATTHQAVCYKE